MSALLGHNPIAYTPWKGTVGQQFSSRIFKNTNSTNSKANFFKAMPLKIYRRESANNNNVVTDCHTSRASVSIDELNRPQGAIRSVNNIEYTGASFTVKELPKNNNITQSGPCTEPAVCAADNARKRVRSSGMVRKKFNPETNESAYFGDAKQYLVSRSKTFQQNLYSHVRAADATLLPDPQQTKTNLFVPNGISHCPKVRISAADNNNFFQYYWLNDYRDITDITHVVAYPVTIPDGYYDVHGLNAAVFNAMRDNGKHYFVNKTTHAFESLIRFAWNSQEFKIELQLYNSAQFDDPTKYDLPLSVGWTLPTTDCVPVVYFDPALQFGSVVGFNTGYYPGISGNILQSITASDAAYARLSDAAPQIHSSYLPMTYKPSNVRFAQQGGVSSGDMTARRKYETIQTVATSMTAAYGKQVANALAYGVSETVYTDKTKYGAPMQYTPVLCGSTGVMQCRNRGKMFNG